MNLMEKKLNLEQKAFLRQVIKCNKNQTKVYK